ncbi:MAG: hypothetical protein ACYC66_13560 [Chloroflexota bacterium]
MKGNQPRIWIALVAALLLTGLVSGCGLDTRFKEITRPLSLSFAVSYLDGRSDVSVRYSIPPPPDGKSYVLWAYDQGRKQVAKLGPVQAGVELRARGTVPFQAVGVIITVEDSPNVTKMVGTGIIELTLEEQNLGPSSGQGGGATGTPTRR